MKYTFPTITHIDDVLPHIEGADEFVVAERGDFTVINYQNITSDTFRPVSLAEDDADRLTRSIRRECRGITFYTKTGETCRRPFHKFKNINEDEDNLVANINFSANHLILDKLDGSMIAPTVDWCGEIFWGSKMLSPEFHYMIEQFVRDGKHRYEEFSHVLMSDGWTPIFEFCSRQNRVVVDHPIDRLVLTGARDIITGQYMSRSDLEDWSSDFDIELVGVRLDSNTAIDNVISTVRGFGPDEEGVVVDFTDGHKVKIKGETYCAIHKVKDQMLWERNVISLVLDNKVDDIVPFLIDSDRERLEKYQDRLVEDIAVISAFMSRESYVNIAIDRMDRKSWAIMFSKKYGSFASIVFKYFEQLDSMTLESWQEIFYNAVIDVVRNACISNAKLEQFKVTNGFKWQW